MKALVVSKLSLGRVYESLIKLGVKELVDFYELKDGWESEKDIIEVMEKEKCDTAVIIANFWLALRLLAKAKLNKVFVIVPKAVGVNEVYRAKIYEIIAHDVVILEHEG